MFLLYSEYYKLPVYYFFDKFYLHLTLLIFLVDDTVIDKNKLIEEVMGGREISDMYLKHPGNESSSDDEGVETQVEIGKDKQKII